MIKASLQVFGDDRWTAMARTVGYPVGIAARLVAEGGITEKGVLIPVKKEIYDPMLSELKDFGITFDISRKAI